MRRYREFIEQLELSHISDQELRAYRSDILSFLEYCSYDLGNNHIIIYINKLKDSYSPKSVRNKLIRIRKSLKFIKHPLSNDIRLPKIPKRRKHVIKTKYIQKILTETDSKLRKRNFLKRIIY